uniref:Uncharacterized protein n=1 Tax=Arundo donax TaxID=35708 RepID=A0A0A9ACG4_ARUDO
MTQIRNDLMSKSCFPRPGTKFPGYIRRINGCKKTDCPLMALHSGFFSKTHSIHRYVDKNYCTVTLLSLALKK